MAGTRSGAESAAKTNKKKDPLYYQKLGRKGGIARVAKGFSQMDATQRSKNAKLGGIAKGKPKISD